VEPRRGLDDRVTDRQRTRDLPMAQTSRADCIQRLTLRSDPNGDTKVGIRKSAGATEGSGKTEGERCGD
jgi:hypothetical protein